MSLFKDVRKYMGIRESFITHQVQQTEEDVIRDMYVEGQIFSIGEEVTDTYTGVTGKIIRRGTNYVTFATEDGHNLQEVVVRTRTDRRLLTQGSRQLV